MAGTLKRGKAGRLTGGDSGTSPSAWRDTSVLPDSPAGPAGGGSSGALLENKAPVSVPGAESPVGEDRAPFNPALAPPLQGQLSLLAHGGHQHD